MRAISQSVLPSATSRRHSSSRRLRCGRARGAPAAVAARRTAQAPISSAQCSRSAGISQPVRTANEQDALGSPGTFAGTVRPAPSPKCAAAREDLRVAPIEPDQPAELAPAEAGIGAPAGEMHRIVGA